MKLVPVPVEAPEWANFVGIDQDGEVWAYEFKPVWDELLRAWESERGKSTLVVTLTAFSNKDVINPHLFQL